MPTKKSAKTARSKKKTPARRKTTKPGARSSSLSLESASPSFTVNDLEKSVAFYRDVVGFAVEETWKDDGKVVGVSLKAGGVSFMIGQDDWKKGRDRRKGEGFRMFCMTKKNVDALATASGRAEASSTTDPDQPWGMRDISLTDPDGFKLTIAAPKR